jgi:hypothetical protein
MIVYVLFVHKNSISKRKVYNIFVKNLKKTKNPPKKTFLVGFLGGFFWVFWVGFFGWFLHCQPWIQAHKVILSACSPFFRGVLKQNPHQHPLLYLKDVRYKDLESVLSFMYHGEVNVAQDQLNSFLMVAEELQVKGLTQSSNSSGGNSSKQQHPPPPSAQKQQFSASEPVISSDRGSAGSSLKRTANNSDISSSRLDTSSMRAPKAGNIFTNYSDACASLLYPVIFRPMSDRS